MVVSVWLRVYVKGCHGIPCGVVVPDNHFGRITGVDLQRLAIRKGDGEELTRSQGSFRKHGVKCDDLGRIKAGHCQELGESLQGGEDLIFPFCAVVVTSNRNIQGVDLLNVVDCVAIILHNCVDVCVANDAFKRFHCRGRDFLNVSFLKHDQKNRRTIEADKMSSHAERVTL